MHTSMAILPFVCKSTIRLDKQFLHCRQGKACLHIIHNNNSFSLSLNNAALVTNSMTDCFTAPQKAMKCPQSAEQGS